jgi:hypothetical protein
MPAALSLYSGVDGVAEWTTCRAKVGFQQIWWALGCNTHINPLRSHTVGAYVNIYVILPV